MREGRDGGAFGPARGTAVGRPLAGTRSRAECDSPSDRLRNGQSGPGRIGSGATGNAQSAERIGLGTAEAGVFEIRVAMTHVGERMNE